MGKRKHKFLNKLIHLNHMILDKPKSADAKMIILGKECEKTNVFLQQTVEAAV